MYVRVEAFTLFFPTLGACTTGDNQIFLAGGAIRKINYRGPFVTEGVSPNLFLYDKTFGSWQVKSKMQHGRCQFSLVMVDGYVWSYQSINQSINQSICMIQAITDINLL